MAAVTVQIRSAPSTASRAEGIGSTARPVLAPSSLGEAVGALRPPAPDPDAAQGPHRPHGVQMGARLHARAEDRQVPRAPLRQHPGGHRARRGRADGGDRRGVQQRQRPPPLVLEQQHHPLVRLLAVQMVVRHHRDHLDPGDRALAPESTGSRQHPRHHRQQAVMVRHPVRRPQRLDRLAARRATRRASATTSMHSSIGRRASTSSRVQHREWTCGSIAAPGRSDTSILLSARYILPGMTFVSDLEPRPLWQHFDAILAIPRPSKHEERACRYVIDQAERRGLRWRQDATGNLVVEKPASPGQGGRAGRRPPGAPRHGDREELGDRPRLRPRSDRPPPRRRLGEGHRHHPRRGQRHRRRRHAGRDDRRRPRPRPPRAALHRRRGDRPDRRPGARRRGHRAARPPAPQPGLRGGGGGDASAARAAPPAASPCRSKPPPRRRGPRPSTSSSPASRGGTRGWRSTSSAATP